MSDDAYPADWKQISARIHIRAGGQCEHIDEHGKRCEALDWRPHPITGAFVILACCHLNHIRADCRDENLIIFCQYHHFRHDDRQHEATAHANRRAKQREAGQLDLWSEQEMEVNWKLVGSEIAGDSTAGARHNTEGQ